VICGAALEDKFFDPALAPLDEPHVDRNGILARLAAQDA